MNRDVNPLVAESPAEVPLPQAPLHRVLAQVRFPIITAIDKAEFISPLQEELRSAYPVLRQDQTQHLVIGPPGAQLPGASPAQTAWRFADEQESWRVSLTSDFLTLETRAYVSRTDFLSRFVVALKALGRHVNPSMIDRLGVRYIDRLRGADLKDLSNLVRAEIRGIGATSFGDQVEHSITETIFRVGQDRILARWGTLPPNRTTDPGAIDPIAEPSWVLDLDMFTTARTRFDVGVVESKTKEFAERLYTVFRWAVTDAFLKRFGATGKSNA